MKAAAWLLIQMVPAATSAAEVSPHARKAVDAVQQLRAIPIADPDPGVGPPANVTASLRTLNAELKVLIVEDLSDTTR